MYMVSPICECNLKLLHYLFLLVIFCSLFLCCSFLHFHFIFHFEYFIDKLKWIGQQARHMQILFKCKSLPNTTKYPFCVSDWWPCQTFPFPMKKVYLLFKINYIYSCLSCIWSFSSIRYLLYTMVHYLKLFNFYNNTLYFS